MVSINDNAIGKYKNDYSKPRWIKIRHWQVDSTILFQDTNHLRNSSRSQLSYKCWWSFIVLEMTAFSWRYIWISVNMKTHKMFFLSFKVHCHKTVIMFCVYINCSFLYDSYFKDLAESQNLQISSALNICITISQSITYWKIGILLHLLLHSVTQKLPCAN